eukprot:TRINITY_DN29193_c0_g1_i1.p1 TRINITY_DN29193_c0_g1~~TRINITY_DN29193_c0_g1_i1.p1  ORF type:complete len:115 (-),score=14.82 TRINITY_DN29193_c0_g1_i1:150-494(-)
MEMLVERFLRYVSFDTQSVPSNSHCPSSSGQYVFAEALKIELEALGLSNVSLDEHGYLMAKLPSNVDHEVPAIGLIAHMDTAPDASGKNVETSGHTKITEGDNIRTWKKVVETP